jgi:hypothetical protein
LIVLPPRLVEGHGDKGQYLTPQLQEELSAAQLKASKQEAEIAKLKAELAIRPRDPDARVVELSNEIEHFKLIAGEFDGSWPCDTGSLE